MFSKVFAKFECIDTLTTSNFTHNFMRKEMFKYVYQNTCTRRFIEILFKVVKNEKKKNKCPFTLQWIDELWLFHIK